MSFIYISRLEWLCNDVTCIALHCCYGPSKRAALVIRTNMGEYRITGDWFVGHTCCVILDAIRPNLARYSKTGKKWSIFFADDRFQMHVLERKRPNFYNFTMICSKGPVDEKWTLIQVMMAWNWTCDITTTIHDQPHWHIMCHRVSMNYILKNALRLFLALPTSYWA